MTTEELNSRTAYLKGEVAKSPDSYLFLPLAHSYVEMGMLEEAEQTCKEGLENHPHYTSARALLGLIHHLRDDDHRAQEELRSVIEEDPRNLLAHRLLGKIYARGGDAQRSVEEYRMALAISGHDEEAAQALRELEGERRGEQFYAHALADIYREQGAIQEAMGIYSALLEKEPQNEQVQERIKELESLLAQKASAEAEEGAPGPAIRLEELPAFRRHIDHLEAELARLRQSNRGLSADDARRAMGALREWLERSRGAPRSAGHNGEGEKEHDQDTGS